MRIKSAIDWPTTRSLNDPLCLRVAGWMHAGADDGRIVAIEVHANGRRLGETSTRFMRPDVERAYRLGPGTPAGFEVCLSVPDLLGQSKLTLQCVARLDDGTQAAGATRKIKLIAHDYRTNHYGVLATPEETRLFHREDIYCSGPSVADANADCVALLMARLGPPPANVLDVGCGIGAYGRVLTAAGHDWFGVEVKASDCEELARLNLRHEHVDGRVLPFRDGAFDTAICIEVLEHIADPMQFLSEIRRVTRSRVMFSVPNLELLPYMQPHVVVPWHLLDGDHKNFFTRTSLRHLLLQHFARVEVLCYARHPLTTPEGIPLYYHLFADARV